MHEVTYEDIHHWAKSTPLTSQGYGNLVPTSFHIASAETSVHATWVDAQTASSVGICLVKLTLNMGQDPLRKHYANG